MQEVINVIIKSLLILFMHSKFFFTFTFSCTLIFSHNNQLAMPMSLYVRLCKGINLLLLTARTNCGQLQRLHKRLLNILYRLAIHINESELASE